jgi:hypothetical protein
MAAARHVGRPLDTGMNIPESRATLQAQQDQLISGDRFVQMFPTGTRELALPRGMKRIETRRGIFLYNPTKIKAEVIRLASDRGHENKLLGLGSVSKADVMHRVSRGERSVAVVERNASGTEVRAAVGTPSHGPKANRRNGQEKESG